MIMTEEKKAFSSEDYHNDTDCSKFLSIYENRYITQVRV